MDRLAESDAKVRDAIRREEIRQRSRLELIASENFASPAVRAAQGSVLTNKYAEGLPGRRYYGGCENVDLVEDLAIKRARRLFGADHANVQPHSGTQANMAAYFAFLEPGDRVLGMRLNEGGHLTHGAPVNFSGRLYSASSYGVSSADGRIDYDEVQAIARRERPKLLVAGASAYPRTLDFEAFGEIARDVGAKLLVDMAHIAGLVAAGAHPSPVGCADVVATSTHKTLRGPRGGMILCEKEHAKRIDSMVFPHSQGGPLMHVIAAKAVALGEALKPAFGRYVARVVQNARTLSRTLSERGIRLVSGGTDTHLLLVDLTGEELTGRAGEAALERAGITVNKNTVPGEARSPFVTSGLRIGTAAATTRGMGADEMTRIGGWIADVLERPEDDALATRIRGAVTELCGTFPDFAADP